MFVRYVFAIMALTALAFVSAMEFGIDNMGGATFEEAGTNQERSIEFKNHYDRPISLYWLDDNGVGIKMGDIGAGFHEVFNSFTGHSFYATYANTNERVDPAKITVIRSKSKYSFGTEKKQKRIHPQVQFLNQKTTSMNAKFRNLIPDTVDIYYEDGRGGTPQGTLTLGKEYTINTYENHVFFFTAHKNKKKELARFVMDKDIVTYLIRDPTRPAPQHMEDHVSKELAFQQEYLNRTGIHWRHFFGPDGQPRGPPTLHMWPTPEIGHVHHVDSDEGHWHCKGSKKDCQHDGPLSLTLEVVSQQPKAFIIEDFLSEYEADHIIALANPRAKESQVGSIDGGGARKDSTRTSNNAWLSRSLSEVTESLSLRAADLLQLDEKMLTATKNAEDIQVVHYVNGQKYDSHHDWGVSGYPESRFITLLLYLTTQSYDGAGGETAFPKAAGGMGIKVAPKKGMAVLFYSLLEDGNGDDLSLHAALPTAEGEEKWLANFWIWDPKRKP